MQNFISTAHAESLRARAISDTTAHRNRMSTVSAAAVAVALYGPGTGFIVHGDSIAIPYHDLEGKPVVGDDGIDYVRFRVSDQRDPKTLPEGQKIQRYLARPSSGMRPYIPAGFTDLAPCSDFMVITEGEFKAASATAMGIPTIALPGVTMWAATAGGALSAETVVHPDILAAVRLSRGVMVLADSDARTNPLVRSSMQALADALVVQAGVPAMYGVCKEPEKQQGKKTPKIGLDDWLVIDGQSGVEKYLLWMWTKEQSRQAILAAGGYFPLGYQDETFYVWSAPKQSIQAMTASALTAPGALMGLVGGLDWCIAAHGKPSKSGAVLVDWQEMGGQLVSACVSAGPFDPDNCRRTGVWDAGHGTLVINGADHLWRTDGMPQERNAGEFVYPRGRKLGLTADTPMATVEEAFDLCEAIGTWNFTRTGDQYLMLGWICHAYLAGAAEWRAHVSLTGGRGTGKSFLQRLAGDLLGKASIACDGDSTPAGIRQHVGTDALALIIDEAEADGRKVADILSFLRSASSGAEVLRGTQDQTGTRFKLRVAGMVAGIVPPVMNAADQSRFVRLELSSVNDDAARNPHRLVADREAAQELGSRLFSRMVHSWPRLERARRVLRAHIGGDARYADTVGPILASAWVALFDGEIDDAEAADFVRELDLDSERARVVDARDEQDAFDHLLGKLMVATVDGKRLDITGAEAIARSLEEVRSGRPSGDYSRSLGRLGLRVVENGENGALLVSAKSPQLKALYTGTKWEQGDLAAVFKRLPGADCKTLTSTISIGGQTVRPLSIALPKLEPATQRLQVAADLA